MGRRDRKERTRRWFEHGADALSRVVPGIGHGYCCPFCLRLVPSLDHLSEEHVPPENIGGRPLVLTCRDCNSRHGAQLDHHIGTRRAIQEVFEGKRPVRGQVTHGGRTLNADISLGPSRTISIPENLNNPRTLDESRARMEREVAARQLGDFTLTLPFRYNEWSEQVAWLRVGYLYAFAALGYRFTLQDVIGPIRDQIRRPSETLLPGLVRGVSPPCPERIAFVREPALLHSVVVTLGKRLVFLPGLGDDPSFYTRMAAPPEDRNFRCEAPVSIELPREPIFWFDFDEAALRSVAVRSYPHREGSDTTRATVEG